MHIKTKTSLIQVVRRDGILYAPIEVHRLTILLKLHPHKSKPPKIDIRRGNLAPGSNNKVFVESIRRIDYLVKYIQSEKLEYLSQLPLKINGIENFGQERLIAFKISAKLRGV